MIVFYNRSKIGETISISLVMFGGAIFFTKKMDEDDDDEARGIKVVYFARSRVQDAPYRYSICTFVTWP